MDQHGDIDLSEPNADGFIAQFREIDVLCGRGGAIQRHPGNQNYRHLVNENKPTYTTCEKSEKLKISKSIVSAVRQLGGRFLVKNKASNLWFDIGDQKAVEKTSQALREGQPKLRQKLVDEGALPPEPEIKTNELIREAPPNPPFAKEPALFGARSRQPEMETVRPPSPTFTTTSEMFRRMSLESSKASSASAAVGRASKPPIIANRAFTVDTGGTPMSQLSLMSEFSTMGSIASKIGSVQLRRPSDTSSIPTRRPSDLYSIASRRLSDMSHAQAGLLINSLSMQSMSLATIDSSPLEDESSDPNIADNVDLRNVFASMKYRRTSQAQAPPQRSTDDFPGFHMVDSSSAYSNISAISGIDFESKRNNAKSSPRHLSGIGEQEEEFDFDPNDLDLDDLVATQGSEFKFQSDEHL